MYVLLFCMCQYVGLEIGRLRKFLVAAVEGAHVRPVAGVDADVCAQVEVKGEALATALECALKHDNNTCQCTKYIWDARQFSSTPKFEVCNRGPIMVEKC